MPWPWAGWIRSGTKPHGGRRDADRQSLGPAQESLQASLDLLAKERQLLRSGSGEDALPDSELLEPYDGRMIVELLWGLFETAIKLEDAQDRAAMHKLALLMAESLSLDSWIAECGPSKI